jgi:hypothetical protein
MRLDRRKVVDRGLTLAAGLSPLALDAREQDKPRKTRRVLGDSDGGDAAALEAVMACSLVSQEAPLPFLSRSRLSDW